MDDNVKNTCYIYLTVFKVTKYLVKYSGYWRKCDAMGIADWNLTILGSSPRNTHTGRHIDTHT